MLPFKHFFSAEQLKQIESCIREAELHSSGEIRVHLEQHCKGEALEQAAIIFHKNGMQHTLLRNGILFFLAYKDHKFAVIGDEGIHRNVPPGFWDTVRNKMEVQFKQGKFTEGLCEGIAMTGAELKKYFPLSDTDANELSNEVTFNKE